MTRQVKRQRKCILGIFCKTIFCYTEKNIKVADLKNHERKTMSLPWLASSIGEHSLSNPVVWGLLRLKCKHFLNRWDFISTQDNKNIQTQHILILVRDGCLQNEWSCLLLDIESGFHLSHWYIAQMNKPSDLRDGKNNLLCNTTNFSYLNDYLDWRPPLVKASLASSSKAKIRRDPLVP